MTGIWILLNIVQTITILVLLWDAIDWSDQR